MHADLIRYFILIIDNILWGPSWSYYMYLSLHDEVVQRRVLNTECVLFNCQDAWSIIYISDPHLCEELSVTGTMYCACQFLSCDLCLYSECTVHVYAYILTDSKIIDGEMGKKIPPKQHWKLMYVDYDFLIFFFLFF